MFSAMTSTVPTMQSEFIDDSQVKSVNRLLSFVFDLGLFSLRRLELLFLQLSSHIISIVSYFKIVS